MIVVVFGLPGTGKSYFSKKLALAINALHINSDVLRKQLFPYPTYTLEEKHLVYKKMFNIMCNHVHKKEHLILDGTFFTNEIRDNFIEHVNLLGGEIKFIELQASQSTIKERMSKKRKFSDADFSVYKLIEGQFDPYTQEHLVLHSTSNNINELIRQALTYLEFIENKHQKTTL